MPTCSYAEIPETKVPACTEERADTGTEAENLTEGETGTASGASKARHADLEGQLVVPQACCPVSCAGHARSGQ